MKYFVKPAFHVAHQKVMCHLLMIRMHARTQHTVLSCIQLGGAQAGRGGRGGRQTQSVCSDDGSNQHLIEWDFSPCTVTNISVCSCSEKFLNLQKQGGKMCKVSFICKSDT